MNKLRLTYKNYRDLFKRGQKFYSKHYLVYCKELDGDHSSIIKTAVKKKIGSAICRNYQKRLMRQVLSKMNWKKQMFILIICHQKPEHKFEKIVAEIRYMLRALQYC